MSKENKPIEAKPNLRFTQSQINRIILEDIIPALRDNKTFPQINKLLQAKYGKSRAAIDKYISKAVEALKQDFNRDVELKRMEMINSLQKDADTAYANYELATYRGNTGTQWFRMYQDIKKRIAELQPNELRADEQDKDKLNITIKYENV